MALAISKRLSQIRFHEEAAASRRLILHRKETVKLPATCEGIHVVSGSVWISWNGQDVVLTANQEIPLTPHVDTPVISGVEFALTVVEVSYR